MTRFRVAIVCAALLGSASALVADVRSDQKSRTEIAGVLGRMMNTFGGKAARDGVTSGIAVKGDRKATLNETSGQIVDLGEEKVYELDMRKKSYKVTTFAELRRRMEEARKKAEENARKQPHPAAAQANPNAVQMDIDVDVKKTGQARTINGFETSETVVTITLRQKGKTVEQGGGMVVTSDMWLAPKIAALQEIAQFDARYAQQLYGGAPAGLSPEEMATALALFPMMKEAMARMNVEGAKVDGTPILTTTTIENVKSDTEMANQAQQNTQESTPTADNNVSRLLGGFARKAVAKKVGGDEDGAQRSTFMTSTNEVLKVTTDVSAADVAVPPGFKEAR